MDIKTVENVANLARIQINDDEKQSLAGDLTKILTFVEQLNEINTDGIEPMTSVVTVDTPMRSDIVNDGMCPDAVLKNAPDRVQNFYGVPKVVE